MSEQKLHSTPTLSVLGTIGELAGGLMRADLISRPDAPSSHPFVKERNKELSLRASQ